jgi:pilus assembly protein Flp/PilA
MIERVEARLLDAWVAVLRFRSGERGQGMAEYGLLLALVAVVVVGTVNTLGSHIQTKINSIATSI